MGEDIIPFFNEVTDKMQGIIKVVGVGGGGCNAVNNMYKEGVEGVTYAVCNTDSQSLSRSDVPVKIQLGEGLGAGGDPEKGRNEAVSTIDSIQNLLSDGTKMVFVTAGMGGGTGTGAAPVVAWYGWRHRYWCCSCGGWCGKEYGIADNWCGDDSILL